MGMTNDEVRNIVVPSALGLAIAVAFILEAWPVVIAGVIAIAVLGWWDHRRRRNRELDAAIARAAAEDDESQR